jgi:hypothetical protein
MRSEESRLLPVIRPVAPQSGCDAQHIRSISPEDLLFIGLRESGLFNAADSFPPSGRSVAQRHIRAEQQMVRPKIIAGALQCRHAPVTAVSQ